MTTHIRVPTRTLGNNCHHLRVVELTCVCGNDSVRNFAPALANIRSFRCETTDYAEFFAATVATSPFLQELWFEGESKRDTNRFVTVFLGSWKGGYLKTFSISSRMSQRVCESLMETIQEGKLQAGEFFAKAEWTPGCSEDVESGDRKWDELKTKLCPCNKGENARLILMD